MNEDDIERQLRHVEKVLGTVAHPMPITEEQLAGGEYPDESKPYLFCIKPNGEVIKWYRCYRDYVDD